MLREGHEIWGQKQLGQMSRRGMRVLGRYEEDA